MDFDYAAMARAFGGYGERITELAQIVTSKGVPALLKFITSKETSIFRHLPQA